MAAVFAAGGAAAAPATGTSVLKSVLTIIRRNNDANVAALQSVGLNASFYKAIRAQIETVYLSDLRDPLQADDDEYFEVVCDLLQQCLSHDARKECLPFWCSPDETSGSFVDGGGSDTNGGGPVRRQTVSKLFVDVVTVALTKLPAVLEAPNLSTRSAWAVARLLGTALQFVGRTDLVRFRDSLFTQFVMIVARCTVAIEVAVASSSPVGGVRPTRSRPPSTVGFAPSSHTAGSSNNSSTDGPRVVNIQFAPPHPIQQKQQQRSVPVDGQSASSRETVNFSVPWEHVAEFVACVTHALNVVVEGEHTDCGPPAKATRAYALLLLRLTVTMPHWPALFPGPSSSKPDSARSNYLALHVARGVQQAVAAATAPTPAWIPLMVVVQLLSSQWENDWPRLRAREPQQQQQEQPSANCSLYAPSGAQVYREIKLLLSEALGQLIANADHPTARRLLGDGPLAIHLTEQLWSFLLCGRVRACTTHFCHSFSCCSPLSSSYLRLSALLCFANGVVHFALRNCFRWISWRTPRQQLHHFRILGLSVDEFWVS